MERVKHIKARRCFQYLVLVFFTVCISEISIADNRGLEWKGSHKPSVSFLKGTYRAIVIGNNRYRDKTGTWKHLRTAVQDAESVAKILKSNYQFKDITLLKNVSRRDILLTLNKLSKRVEPDDNILIYYAGHGHLDEDTKRGYWIPVDAKGMDNTTYIRNSTIRDEVSIIAEKTRHTLLISDSCFSGSLLRGGNRAIRDIKRTNPYYLKVSNKKSVQILTAGGVEFVDDDYRDSGHSPFTYFLLNELQNNLDTLLTMSELSNNVIKAVANNVDQMPEAGVLQGAGDELGEFIFVRQATNKSNIAMASRAITDENEGTTASRNIEKKYLPMPRF